VGAWLADRKLNRVVRVDVAAVALPADAAALDRGRYLYASRGCVDCHGADGAGRTFVNDGGLRIAGPNISPGPGSVVAAYRAEDWVRTLRHGVKPDGRPVMVMPSEDYSRLTDLDLGALAAYVRSLPPAAGGPAVIDLPLPVRALYAAGVVKDAAEKIDHTLPPAQPVPEGVTVEHGRYVAQMCVGCHGRDFAGGRIPGAPPDWPPAADLRPGAGLAAYPEASSLLAMFRSGRRADGSVVQVMPFESLRAVSETDVRALHLFLKSLPPKG
jgi:mono/diheme cytochrome c family protein